MYVQAVNSKGNKSARTANKVWFNMRDWKVQKADAPIQVYTWDRKVTDTQEYPSFPSVNTSHFSGAKKLNTVRQKTTVPVYPEESYSGSFIITKRWIIWMVEKIV